MNNSNGLASIRYSKLFATIAAAVFLGGSGSVLVFRLLEPTDSARPAEESMANAGTDSKVADALLQLAKELRESRLNAPPTAAPSGEPSQRSIATESGESALAELAAAVRELRSALPHADGIPSSAASLPPVTRPHADQIVWLPELTSEDEKAAYSRQRMFWSEQQILDSYGVPSSIRVMDNGVATWHYEDPDDGKRSFYVQFHQGRAIHIEGP